MAAMSPVTGPVSLVLGGGGAKGIVHIGVMEALIESGMELGPLVGTSIGAIWAALFANALAHEPHGPFADRQQKAFTTLKQLAFQLRFSDYKDRYWLNFSTKGYLKGDAFEYWLETMTWSVPDNRLTTFRDLRTKGIDLTVTATDALTGESLACSARTTPDLAVARAVRASMSIQGYFKDCAIDFPRKDGVLTARRCWDGGNTGNCRLDVAYLQNPDLPIVGSSVTYRGEPNDIDAGAFRIPLRSLRMMGQTVSILMQQFEQAMIEWLERQSVRMLVVRPPLMDISTLKLDLPNVRKAAAIEAAKHHTLSRLADWDPNPKP